MDPWPDGKIGSCRCGVRIRDHRSTICGFSVRQGGKQGAGITQTQADWWPVCCVLLGNRSPPLSLTRGGDTPSQVPVRIILATAILSLSPVLNGKKLVVAGLQVRGCRGTGWRPASHTKQGPFSAPNRCLLWDAPPQPARVTDVSSTSRCHGRRSSKDTEEDGCVLLRGQVSQPHVKVTCSPPCRYSRCCWGCNIWPPGTHRSRHPLFRRLPVGPS